MRIAYFLPALMLVGCGLRSNEWVLQSFVEEKGYVFTKNGVQYQTTCVATGRPVVGRPPNEVPDADLDALPPDPAYSETSCSDILIYLGKPVPHLRQVGGSILVFTDAEHQNFRLEFEIKQAK